MHGHSASFFLENATDQRELAVLVNDLFVVISVFTGFSLKLKDHLVSKGKCHVVKLLASDLPCASFDNSDSDKMTIGQSVFI